MNLERKNSRNNCNEITEKELFHSSWNSLPVRSQFEFSYSALLLFSTDSHILQETFVYKMKSLAP